MKYSLSSRQPAEYLAQADEIRIAYRDRNFLLDAITLYPEATLNLRLRGSAETAYDWDEIQRFDKLAKGKLIVSCNYLTDVQRARDLGLKTAWTEPVRSYRELRALARLCVEYVVLDAPLFFDLSYVSSLGVPLRVCANVASYDWLQFDDNVCGPYLRPEDQELYAPYIDTIEFALVNLEQERALFRIYKNDGEWPGRIQTIIPALQTEAVNRLILPEMALCRLNCRQQCQSGSACKVCYRAFELAEKGTQLKEISRDEC